MMLGAGSRMIQWEYLRQEGQNLCLMAVNLSLPLIIFGKTMNLVHLNTFTLDFFMGCQNWNLRRATHSEIGICAGRYILRIRHC